MKALFVLVLVATVALPTLAGKLSEAEREELQAWAQSLHTASIYKAVVEHEQNPLGSDAKKLRPIPVVHFEPVDCVVCLDQIGPLLDSKKEARRARPAIGVAGCSGSRRAGVGGCFGKPVLW
jgi:hypothetical protein